ncbi:EF-hand domain-containing protein [Roseobacteraceae bacterium S113]
MKNAGKLALGGALIVLMAAGPVLAERGPGGKGGPRMSFEQLDADGDGALTKAEIQNAGAARFAAADTNGDGLLSADEMAAQASKRHADRIGKMMERADANGDGMLSLEELEAQRGARAERRMERMFDKLDADGDGAISSAEFEARKSGKRNN